MSARPASLLAAYRAVPSLVPSPDAVRYEQLRLAFREAIVGADTPMNLIRVIISLPEIQSIDKPLSNIERDYLLRLNARAHAKALVTLARWFSDGQIDAGMEALAAWIVWLAEPRPRRLRSEAALCELLSRKMIFRNQLEILVLAESLTRDLPDATRDTDIARIVGGWW